MSAKPAKNEMSSASDWIGKTIAPGKGIFPVSFKYGGLESVALIKILDIKNRREERGPDPSFPSSLRVSMIISRAIA